MANPPQFDHLRGCAHPVVFETGIAEAPFSVAGTAFVVGFESLLYVLTARHVVRDWSKEQIAIIMSAAGERLALRTRWEIRFHTEDAPSDENDDDSDLLIYRADLEGISPETRRSNHLLHLTPPNASSWFETRDESLFFLFGYPTHANGPDYEQSKVVKNQYLLHGQYVGPSITDGCFEIQVKNPLNLSTFAGLSGSPVFSLRTSGEPIQPTFCGMALRGTIILQHLARASAALMRNVSRHFGAALTLYVRAVHHTLC